MKSAKSYASLLIGIAKKIKYALSAKKAKCLIINNNYSKTMGNFNPYLPANHQNIDDIPEPEEDKEEEE